MVSNEDIGIDEDELRRLLEDPASEDKAADAADLEDVPGESSTSTADDQALDMEGDAGQAATAESSAALGQDAIDQLLSHVRGNEPVDSASSQAAGLGATVSGQEEPASGAGISPSSRAAAAPTGGQRRGPVTVQPVQFSPLSATSGRRDRNWMNDLGILLDVPLHITVELGRAEMAVRDILALGPGSVIELDRSAGDVLDVLVNGTLIAQGEVVVVDEQFGIRLTHVLSPNKKLLEGLGGN